MIGTAADAARLRSLYRDDKIAGYHLVTNERGEIVECGVTPHQAIAHLQFAAPDGATFCDFIREMDGQATEDRARAAERGALGGGGG